jgi:hypothetical protein
VRHGCWQGSVTRWLERAPWPGLRTNRKEREKGGRKRKREREGEGETSIRLASALSARARASLPPSQQGNEVFVISAVRRTVLRLSLRRGPALRRSREKEDGVS